MNIDVDLLSERIAKQQWDQHEAEYWDHETDRRDFYKGLLYPEDHEDSSRGLLDEVRKIILMVEDELPVEPVPEHTLQDAGTMMSAMHAVMLKRADAARRTHSGNTDQFILGWERAYGDALRLLSDFVNLATGEFKWDYMPETIAHTEGPQQ